MRMTSASLLTFAIVSVFAFASMCSLCDSEMRAARSTLWRLRTSTALPAVCLSRSSSAFFSSIFERCCLFSILSCPKSMCPRFSFISIFCLTCSFSLAICCLSAEFLSSSFLTTLSCAEWTSLKNFWIFSVMIVLSRPGMGFRPPSITSRWNKSS
eukprot:Amastigsp_a678701_74.p3 type:complete len:155 gc:universal Amastigsp_a678701_74:356-820(+)